MNNIEGKGAPDTKNFITEFGEGAFVELYLFTLSEELATSDPLQTPVLLLYAGSIDFARSLNPKVPPL